MHGAPRWVKVSGLVVLALVLLFLGAKILGVGGEHGPGRHAPPADDPAGSHVPTASGHGGAGRAAEDALASEGRLHRLATEPLGIRAAEGGGLRHEGA